jgi:hypothetical protein
MNDVLPVSYKPALQFACWLVVGLFGSLAQAQPLRDPTVPPVAAGDVVSSGAASGAAPALPSIQPGGMAVLVRDGVPYLVVGTRLYAKGQKVGQARIERISETEVWLREAGGVRKVPVFGGIQRQVSKPVIKPVIAASNRSISSPAVAQSKPRGPSP